jgi:hypothetical protein
MWKQNIAQILVTLVMFASLITFVFFTGSSITGRVTDNTQSGVWIPITDENYIGGSALFSNMKDSVLSYNMAGDVTIVTQTRDDFGIMNVYADNVLIDTIDMYSPDVIYNVRHTYNIYSNIQLKVLGTKNNASTGYYVLVDEVIGQEIEAPTMVENVTEENITELPIENLTEQNVTDEIIQNVTVENITTPVIIEENLTENLIENISAGENLTDTFGEIIPAEDVIEEDVQGHAEIGKTVIWTKHILINKNFTAGDKLKLKVPKTAVNLVSKHKTKELMSASANDTEKQVSLTLEENVTEYTLEYETEAPSVAKRDISRLKKQIIISSDVHYTEIFAYAKLPVETPPENVKLYRVVDTERELVTSGIGFQDSDSNGKLDTITWTVPHLSTETYEIEITILNVQSYPKVGGEWRVQFTTTGAADLYIRAVNLTTWSDTADTEDLRFLDIRCGTEIVPSQWINNDTVYIANYSCAGTGYETSNVITPGKHDLEFKFGNMTQYAHNVASNTSLEWFTQRDGLNINGNTTVTIPVSVNTSRAFVLLSAAEDAANDDLDHMGLYARWIPGTTNQFQIVQFTAGVVRTRWEVVEGRHINVYSGTATTSFRTGLRANATIPEVDLNKSIIIFGATSNQSTSTSLSDMYWMGNFTNSTLLFFQRGITTAPASIGTIGYFVVEFNDGSTVIDGQVGDAGAAPNLIKFQPRFTQSIDPTNSWVIHSNTAGTTAARAHFSSLVKNSTSIVLNLITDTGTHKLQYYVVSTPGAKVYNNTIPITVQANMTNFTKTDAVINTFDTNRSALIGSLTTAATTTLMNGENYWFIKNSTHVVTSKVGTASLNTVVWQVIEFPLYSQLPVNVSNQLNYTTNRYSYVYSAQSSESGTCTLWANWSGSWAPVERLVVDTDTPFNFTTKEFVGSAANYAWNVNCTSDAGNMTWGTNISFTTAAYTDSTPPTVNSVRNWTNDRVNYVFSVTSSEAGTCQLYGNWTGSWAKNESKSATAATALNFTGFAVIANTTNYQWEVNCSDATGNVGWSVNTTFTTKDNYGPNVNYVRNWTNNKINYVFSSQSSEDSNCTLYGNWTGTWLKNETLWNVTKNLAFNFTQFTFLTNNTNYMWRVNCSDTEFNVGWSNNVSFMTGDTYAPAIVNQTNFTTNRLTYTFSAQASENSNCTLMGNWTGVWAVNETMWNVTKNLAFNFTRFTLVTNNTNYMWAVNCSDIGNNVGWSANVSFTTSDSYVPNVDNLRNWTNDQMTYVFSATSSENSNCTLYTNFTGVWAKNETLWNLTAGVPFNFTRSVFLNSSRSHYIWAVNCSDTFRNVGWSVNISFDNVNHVPYATNVVIRPSVINNTLSEVNGRWTYNDRDSDPENATIYEWYINGTNAWKDGLVSYWRFDNNALDSLGRNNGTIISTITQPLNVSGKIKSAYLFDGNNNINVTHHQSINLTEQFTVSAWIKPTTTSGIPRIVEKAVDSVTGGGFLFRILNNRILGQIVDAGVDQSCVGTSTISIGVWTHVALTFDANINTLICYVDAVNESTLSNVTHNIISTTKSLVIGGSNIVDANFDGVIDEVMIWNRSLSAQEIGDLYNMTKYGQIDGSGANHTIANLSSRYYGVNTTLTFGVTLYDGYNYGYQYNSTIVTVGKSSPIISNMINYTNEKLNYTMSAISSDTGVCTLYGDWGGSWAKNETVSVTANVRFNFTRLYVGDGMAHLWGINCTESEFNTKVWSANMTFTPLASDICNSGNALTTCYVSSVHQAGVGIYTFNNLIIQAKGQLNLSRDTAISVTGYIQIDNGGNITSEGQRCTGGKCAAPYGLNLSAAGMINVTGKIISDAQYVVGVTRGDGGLVRLSAATVLIPGGISSSSPDIYTTTGGGVGGNGGTILINATYITVSGGIIANGSSGDSGTCNTGNGGLINITGSYINVTGTLMSLAGVSEASCDNGYDTPIYISNTTGTMNISTAYISPCAETPFFCDSGSTCTLSHRKCLSGEYYGGNLRLDSRGELVVSANAGMNFTSITLTSGSNITKIHNYNLTFMVNASTFLMQSGSLVDFDNPNIFRLSTRSHSIIYASVTNAFIVERNANITLRGDLCNTGGDPGCADANDIHITSSNLFNHSGYIISEGRDQANSVGTDDPGDGGKVYIYSRIIDISGTITADSIPKSRGDYSKGSNGGLVFMNATHIAINGTITASGGSGDDGTGCTIGGSGSDGDAGIINISGTNINVTGTLESIGGQTGYCKNGRDSPIYIRNESGTINISAATLNPCADTSYWCVSGGLGSSCIVGHKKCVTGNIDGIELRFNSNGRLVILEKANLSFTNITLSSGLKIDNFANYNTTLWINATNFVMQPGSIFSLDDNRGTVTNSWTVSSTVYFNTQNFVMDKNSNISLLGDPCSISTTIACSRAGDIQIISNITNLSGYIASMGRVTSGGAYYRGPGGWINISANLVDISGNISADSADFATGSALRGGDGGYVLINGTQVSISGRVSSDGSSGDIDDCSGLGGVNGNGGVLNITGKNINISGTLSAIRGMDGMCYDGYDSIIYVTNSSGALNLTTASFNPCVKTVNLCDIGTLNDNCIIISDHCLVEDYNGNNLTLTSGSSFTVFDSANLNLSTFKLQNNSMVKNTNMYNTTLGVNATNILIENYSIFQFDGIKSKASIYNTISSLSLSARDNLHMAGNISVGAGICYYGSITPQCPTAGNIKLDAGLLNLSGLVTANAPLWGAQSNIWIGNGGSINLTADEMYISGRISADSQNANSAFTLRGGDGGTIMINATSLTVSSQISADGSSGDNNGCVGGTQGMNGNGGRINITTQSFTHTGNITAMNGTYGLCKNVSTIGDIWVDFNPSCALNSTNTGAFRPQEKYAGGACTPATMVFVNLTMVNTSEITQGNPARTGENATIYVNITSNTAIDKVWIVVWQTFAEGISQVWRGFLSLISGTINAGIWSVGIPVNETFPSIVNYTVYMNNTVGNIANISGNFSIVDVTGPTITGQRNWTNDTSTYIFGAISSENSDCTLYGNWSGSWAKNETRLNVIANVEFNFTSVKMPNSTNVNYMWGVNCSDALQNVGWGANISFNILNHKPYATNVQIVPTTVYSTISEVGGTWEYNDYDSNHENATVYEWFINGTEAWKEKSLILYWKFDANALDSSTHSNDGKTNIDVMNDSGKIRGGYLFDGNKTNVSVSNNPSLRMSSWTLSAWIKPITNAGTVGGRIIEKTGWTETGGYSLRLSNENILAEVINAQASSQCTGTSTLSPNQWYHVAATYDNESRELICYVNGMNESTNNAVSIVPIYDNAPLSVGVSTVAQIDYFNGTIDEVMVWNRSLSLQEISDLYNMTKYGQIDASGANHTIVNLSSRYYGVGTNLTFRVTPYDSYEYGIQTNSVMATVATEVVDIIAPTVDSLRNWTTDMMTYVFSANSSEAGTCTLYGNWTGSWAKNESKAVGVNTIFNFTAFSFTSNGKNYQWGVNCSDASHNTGWSANVSFTVASVTNILPSINSVKFSDLVTGYAACPDCTMNPIAGSNISFAVWVNITDADKNCNDSSYGKMQLYLCVNESAYQDCSSTAYNYTYAVDNISGVADYCIFSFNVNKTKETMQFFHPANKYKYHINLTDAYGRNATDARMNGTFTYGTLLSVNYASSVILGGTTIENGIWSSGTNEYIMTNYGNAIINVRWNTTSYVRAGAYMNLTPDGTDFMLDDDNSQSSEITGMVPAVYLMPDVDRYFNYSTGLERCISKDCNSVEYNETLSTYYHLKPPLGLGAGTYAGTITYVVVAK